MKIKIHEGLEIGDNCPPFIIAEVGSNWHNLDDCLLSIERAKECGADAVKFQAFTTESLYGVSPEKLLEREAIEAGERGFIKVNDHPTREYSLPLHWLPKLKEKAERISVEFMCSAFSPELIDAVDPFVNIHKLASAEMCHVRMLEKLRSIGKPVFMSTGAHTVDEMRQSIEYLCNPLVLMYCVASYPAQEIDFGVMCDMKAKFQTLVGFSDHTQDIAFIPREAYRIYGASVIEKHVNFISGIGTPDTAHSLSQDQFRQMVHSIRGERYVSIGPVREELPMINRHNRRLIATKEIKEGDEFREGSNFGIYRSLRDTEPFAQGISSQSEQRFVLRPFDVSRIEGKKAKKETKAGDAICEGDYK